MKKYLFLLLAAPVFMPAAAQESAKEPYLVKSLTAEAIQHVKAETSGGSIAAAGVNTEARIEVYVSPNNSHDRNFSKEEIKKRLEENYDLTITTDNHSLTAIAKQKHPDNNWRNGVSISFKIFVPHATSTDLSTSGGSISLTSLTGKQDFTTSGGSLNVDHLDGHIKGRTSGGSITLSDLKDDIDLSTSGGSIHASNTEGKILLSTSGGSVNLHTLKGTINATTSGGSVDADAVEGELTAHTSGGHIHMQDLSCSLETSTSGGNISVSFKALGKFVKISNSGGSIDLQIPAGKGVDLALSADKVTADALSGFSGDLKNDHINGTLNGGGIPITVKGASHLRFSTK